MNTARNAMLGLLAAAPLLGLPGLATAQGKNLVGDETVVASLNPPPATSRCADAAGQTSVFFNFAHPQFQVTQLSLYVDGQGVPKEAVDEHWPTVTLKSGLHAGLNTIDVVASGASGQTMDRRLQVQIGPAQGNNASAIAVACDDTAIAAEDEGPVATPLAQQDAVAAAPSVAGGGDLGATAPPATAVAPPAAAVQDQGTEVAQAPPPAAVQVPPGMQPPPTAYADAAAPYTAYPAAYPAYPPDTAHPDYYYGYPPPAYIYNPYPVVALDPWAPFVPFFSFGFFYANFHPYYAPPVFAYHPYWNGHGWAWRGGYAARSGAYGHAFASQNYAPHSSAGAATASRGYAAPEAGRGAFSSYQAPHYSMAAAPARSYAASAYSAYRGGGAPATGGRSYSYAAPAHYGGWGGAPRGAAPAFRGGGYGGGFHGGGGGFHGGGGHHR